MRPPPSSPRGCGHTGVLRVRHCQPHNIHTVVRAVTDAFVATAQAKGLTYTVDIAETVPATLIVDDVRLQQVIINLVGGNTGSFQSKFKVWG